MKKSTFLGLFLILPVLLFAGPVSKQPLPSGGFPLSDIQIFIGFVFLIFLHLSVFLLITDRKMRKAEKLKRLEELELEKQVLEELPLEITFSTTAELEEVE